MCVYSCALEEKVKLYHKDTYLHIYMIKTKYSSLKPLDFCLLAPRFLVHIFICLLFHIDVGKFLSK